MTAHRLSRLAVTVGALVGVGLLAGVAVPARASASADQVSIIQDAPRMLSDPVGTLSTFRELGAQMVRLAVVWAQIAPAWEARTSPAGFNAADPASYPPANWAPYDDIVRLATAYGMQIDATLTGGAPRWAEGPGIPPAALDNQYWAWRPSPQAFGQFVRAVGERYSGNYDPYSNTIDPGNPEDLPRINFWAIWNEPNFGEDLGPQATRGSTVATGPLMYRSLVGQAWDALQATGHGADTILIGEFAPFGLSGPATAKHPQGYPGQFAQTKPLRFLRTLYCVDGAYRPLRGAAARAVGCPTTVAGSRAFRRHNPGLFNATGLADHPYPHNQPPTIEPSSDPDIATFPRLPNLERALDRVQRVYGSRRRLPIYNTEYGYITAPPGGRRAWVSPATAAYYLNWAEYLSWKQPRIASTMQYLLYDPPPDPSGHGGFASGLLFSNGLQKPTYAAYRLPLYLPVVSARRGKALEVWGCVRPARYAILDTGQAQTAQIQLAPSSSGTFATIQTVTISNPNHCYFDIRVRFPASGVIRLAYSYPPVSSGGSPPGSSSGGSSASSPPSPLAGATVYSRTVAVTLR